MLTVPEAAKLLGRHPETVRRWIREGKLPATKVGTQHVIDEADLALIRGTASASGARRIVRLAEAVAPYHTSQVEPRRSPEPVDPWLPAIVGRIVRLVDPVRIVLFGSRGRGDAREDSDYDLLVIVDATPNRRETRIAIHRALADLPISKDVVVVPVAEAAGARPRGVLYWALEEGQVVYERA